MIKSFNNKTDKAGDDLKKSINAGSKIDIAAGIFSIYGYEVLKKELNKIQKITWKYKLAENTIGISKTDNVTEIQVFEIKLKEQVIPKNILKVIDKTISYQILYQFVYKDNIAYGITLKENNIAKITIFLTGMKRLSLTLQALI